jgi:L-iditol 2-dehydrogenase
MGATYTINAKEEDVVKKINELTNGRGVDVTFECAGQTATTQITPYITKPGGVITLVGVTSEEVYPMPMLEIAHMRELDVRGVFRYANVHSLTVKLLGEGKLDAKPLITHSFSLEQTKEALEFVDQNKDKVIKAVIKP